MYVTREKFYNTLHLSIFRCQGKIFTERAVRHWHRVPREAVEVFKARWDEVLSMLELLGSVSAHGCGLEQNGLQGHPNHSVIL